MENICGGGGMARSFVSIAFGFALTTPAIVAPLAHADLSETVFTIQATNDSGTGFYSAAFAAGEWDPNEQTYYWSLPESLELYDDETEQWVASLLDATVFVRATQLCEIELNIGIISGESDTTFVVGSPLVSFAETIPAGFARGRATASVTLTDGLGDGAYLVGLGPLGSGVYRSYYNGYLADGTRFTHLVGSIYVDNGGTATASQSDPLVGFRMIGESIDDMSAELAFTVTPTELAFATTTTGLPEPEPCFGDVNDDGVIDTADLGELLAAYGTCEGDPGYNPAVDLAQNGCIDMADLSALLAVYGVVCW